jgi:hypothetical protein
MLNDDIKQDSNNAKVIDDAMDELENLLVKTKAEPPIKREEDEHKKKKKHHRHRSPDSKHDRKKSR